MKLQPGQSLGRYQLIEKIGEGGMGSVWKARDAALGRLVALKVVSQEWSAQANRLELFESEARTLAALNHPHIVTIHSVDEEKGVRFITMEFVEGPTLSKLIPAGGMTLKRLLDVAITVCDALAAAHKAGVVHRDLKPSNVILGEDGRIKVLDFGLATPFLRPSREKEGGGRSTETGPFDDTLSGTLDYMSPEQIQGRPLDARSDLFSLGVVLYEMATGRRPFVGSNPAALIASILRDTPPLATRINPALPLRLGRTIASCLEKDPAYRCESALELGQKLKEIRGDLASMTPMTDRSIAVLPFSDLSAGKDQGHLCEGIAEEILMGLSRVRNLRVASRQASFRAKAAGGEISDIARRLGVSTLLDGSVRKSGDHLRVTVELVDAADGFRLWAERYDRDIHDVFAVQDEIAQRVIDALQLTLSTKDAASLRRAPSPDIAAYEYYLRGRRYFYQYERRAVAFARDLFERAIALEPRYARAYAGLADSCAYMYVNVGRHAADLDKAAAAAEKAVLLDPELAEAYASLGTTLSLRGRHAEAEEAFQKSIRLNADLFEAHYFYARHSFIQGKLEQALEHYEQASRVQPDDYQSPLLVAQIYEDLGRPEEAAASRRKGISIAEERLKLNPDDVRALYMGANGLVALGEVAKGLEWAGKALDIDPRGPMVLYNAACIYSLAGSKEKAMDALEAAMDEGGTPKEWLAHDSNLDPLRNEPRFRDLMARWGL